MQVLENLPVEAREWTKMTQALLDDREIPRQQLGKALRGYKAAVDAPSNEFFEELVKENPGLKVCGTLTYSRARC